MKTIEEAAREYGRKVSPHSDWTARNAEISFTAGAEFSQRWIDPKEELPDVGATYFEIEYGNSEDVIVKSGTAVYIGYYSYNTGSWTLKGQTTDVKVIGWRPIELKL